MRTINNYISEKLKLDKDIKINSTYRNDVYDEVSKFIQDITFNSYDDKLDQLLQDWINDYSKRIYCYVSDKEFDSRYKEWSGFYSYLSLNKVNDTLLKKAENLANQSCVYKGKELSEIKEINLSQYDLAIYFSTKRAPIIFEKSKI